MKSLELVTLKGWRNIYVTLSEAKSLGWLDRDSSVAKIAPSE